MGSFVMRICEWCGGPIGSERKAAAKTCSDDCYRQRRLARAREHAAAKYQPRPPRPVAPCARCGLEFTTYHDGNIYCSRRCSDSAAKAKKRPAPACYKCAAPLPQRRKGQPGKAVCDSCRVDPRVRGKAHEQRRRLRTYGLTQEQYDAMLESQGHRCGICFTAEPGGAKGWAIDHCHSTGAVRGLLCNRCNLGLGMFGDDPGRVSAAREYLLRHQTRAA